MKKEITDIVKAAAVAQKESKKMALATVVHVEGSSYRRAGARMLVTEDGSLTGAISGGCLEGDALRKALLAMNEGRNKLVTYDTSDDEDAKVGVQLGCNGIVHILFEPVNYALRFNTVDLLMKLNEGRHKGVITTAFDLDNRNGFQPGTCNLFMNGENYFNESIDKQILSQTGSDIVQVYEREESGTGSFTLEGQEYSCFHEFITPPVSLVIFGAGNDVIPLVNMAAILGWKTHVLDGRPNHASPERFPVATSVTVSKPADVLRYLSPDEFTVYILMSHNYNYDLEVLRILVGVHTRYIGILGPKKKLEKMLDELESEGEHPGEKEMDKLFGPVGSDIGAETAEEIALSVLSEIKAVFAGRPCFHLRDKVTSIHAPAGNGCFILSLS